MSDSKDEKKGDFDYSLFTTNYPINKKTMKHVLEIFPVIFSSIIPEIGLIILEYYMPQCMLSFIDEWFIEQNTTRDLVEEYPHGYYSMNQNNDYRIKYNKIYVNTPYIINDYGAVYILTKTNWFDAFHYNSFMIFLMKACSVDDMYMINHDYNLINQMYNNDDYFTEQLKRHNLFLVASFNIYIDLVNSKKISSIFKFKDASYNKDCHKKTEQIEIKSVKKEYVSQYIICVSEEYEHIISAKRDGRNFECWNENRVLHELHMKMRNKNN
jgi:hypothetical protein